MGPYITPPPEPMYEEVSLGTGVYMGLPYPRFNLADLAEFWHNVKRLEDATGKQAVITFNRHQAVARVDLR